MNEFAPEHVEVEWLILADSAEVLNNKLYLLGGGWDVLTINTPFPVQHHMAAAVSFRVPWTATNQQHAIEIELQSEDGATLVRVGGQFEVGRPPGTQHGQPQRTQLAMSVNLAFPASGTYVVLASVNGQDPKRVPFRVVASPQLLLSRPEQGGQRA